MKATALALLLALGFSERCVAGTTGVLNGYVIDRRGHAAARTLVRAISPSLRAKTYTDKRGFFVFLTLPPDLYSVYAEGGLLHIDSVVRINSDQTTFFVLDGTTVPNCSSFVLPSLGADQRSEQFDSLDLRQMGKYPPGVASVPILLPIAPVVGRLMCM